MVSYIYDAWGNIFSVTGTMAATLGVDNPFRYRGYFYDEETKFYYLQSRYYDPNVCRFINADEFNILYNAVGNVLGANVFIYCMNNPVMHVDYSGHYVVYYFINLTDTRKIINALYGGAWIGSMISGILGAASLGMAAGIGSFITSFIGYAAWRLDNMKGRKELIITVYYTKWYNAYNRSCINNPYWVSIGGWN